MRWFRAYADIVDDDKLRLLAFEDRWHFVAICALKCAGLIDEPISELRERKIAVKLGLALRECDEVKRRLMEVGLIDDEWQPGGWDRRQYDSDSAAERMRRYRQRQKESGDTQPLRNGDVTVTNSETETETDISPNGDMGRKRKRFVVPTVEEVTEYIRQQGYQVDPARFVNHYASVGWRVGKSPMKSWHHAVAGWHNRETNQQGPPGRGLRGRSIRDDLTDRGWAE